MSLTEHAVIGALRPIQDPDLRKSIVDLGFIKELTVRQGRVAFKLELTTPACPVKDQLKAACVAAVERLDGVKEVHVEMTAQTRGGGGAARQVLSGVKNVIAVASGKGGVAKSTTAVNLALALRQTGATVGILDADIYGPSVPTMIRMEREPAGTSDQRIIPAEGLGLKVISIGFFMPPDRAAILRGPMVSGYVSQFLTGVEWGPLDYLIIDYPPGTGDIQLTLSQQCPITGAVVCTTPQEISLIDVRRGIAMFETTKVPVLGVIETMSYFICDGCNKRHDIFRSGGGERIARRIGVPFLGAVPIDPLVAEDSDTGVPVIVGHPDSPAAKAYRELAGAVAAQLSILNVERGSYLETFSLTWKA
ncbi:MAG: Mrp/NBP35 family ATP-binding protein [Deltaproteobacteria bacterium]|nr:Mrp/NBP35 family ATP-binding protein [Deltaproteobacteria bacterium]